MTEASVTERADERHEAAVQPIRRLQKTPDRGRCPPTRDGA